MPIAASCIAFDLDSTLADTRHRRHLIPSREAHGDNIESAEAWAEYSNACMDDEPIAGNVALLNLIKVYAPSLSVAIVSGRSVNAWENTVAWLNAYRIQYDLLRLRPMDNRQANGPYKRDVLQGLKMSGITPRLLIDDWPDTANFCMDVCPVIVSLAPENWHAVKEVLALA